MTQIVVRRSARVPDCSLCRDAAADVASIRCPGCGARYHASCFEELATRCATIGCNALHALAAELAARAFTPVPADPPEPTPLDPTVFVVLFTALVVAPILTTVLVMVGQPGLLKLLGIFAGLGLCALLAWGVVVFARAITPPPRRRT